MFTEKCWSCGTENLDRIAGVTYCNECKVKHEARIEKLKATKKRANIELMAIRAMDMIAKDKHREKDIHAYKKSFRVVLESARETPAMFDSSEEMAVAICLHQQKKHFYVQYKVGARRVDICLPEEKLLIEIDGSRHDNREFQDTVRDIEILQKLGRAWEIAHVRAAFVNEKPTRVYARAYSIAEEKRKNKARNGYTVEPEVAEALMHKELNKRRKNDVFFTG